MEDKIIQNTFNAFWSIKFGKNALRIDWRTMFALCKANEAIELKSAMKDIMDTMKPFIDKQEWTDADWTAMIDAANECSKRYQHDRAIMGVLLEVANYVDRRESIHKRHENIQRSFDD